MNRQELRINNLFLNHENKIYKVDTIENGWCHASSKNFTGLCMYESIIGIDITPYLLAKLNFTYNGEGNVNQYKYVDAFYSYGEDKKIGIKFVREWYGTHPDRAIRKIELWHKGDYLITVKYLHEIQNMYFLLSYGEELLIDVLIS